MNAYLWNYFYTLIITSATAFLLGGFILLKNPKRFLNRILALYLFSVFIWSFFQSWLGIADNEKTAVLFERIEHIGVIFIPIFYLHFVLAFLGLNKLPVESLWLKVNYGAAFLFLLLLPTSYFMKGVDSSGPLRFIVEPGWAYAYSIGWMICLAIYGAYKLFKASLSSTGRLRQQAKCLFWASVIGYIGGLPNYFYAFDYHIPIVNPYFTYGVVIHTCLIAYCIAKHKLLDIEIPFKTTVIYSLIYSFAVGIFYFLVVFFGQWLVYGQIDKRIIWMCVVTLFIITATVKPLDTFFTHLTDKTLFRKKYEYQKTLREASSGMASIRDLDKLLNLIVTVITKHVRVKQALIFVWDNKKEGFCLRAARPKVGLADKFIFDLKNPLVCWLNKTKDALIYSELIAHKEKNEFENNLKEGAGLEETINQLKNLNMVLCVPSFFEGRLIAFLLLGGKLSQDIYTQEDINLFMTLANQAASAIENCWAYTELQEKDRLLMEAEKLAAIGRLAGNIAHEIKNPLAPIKTYTEFLDERITDPQFRQDFKKVILEETNCIDHIVQALLDYAHPKKLNKVKIDIHQTIDNTLHLLENDLAKQSIKVSGDYALDAQDILADAEQLKQVFLNLFLNSIQAMEDISDRIKELKIKTRVNNNSLIIKIQDAGCGIKKEDLPFIFDPFFSTKEKGSGLGLSIVQGIIKNHGGTITAESQPEVGTTFSINLPK